MEVWSHRGSQERTPENTIEAFSAAIDSGVSGIELDVRMCGSGEVVVFHDPMLWRMARKFLFVKSTSLKTVRAEAGYYVPTLNEVLEEFQDKTNYILDIKPCSLKDKELEKEIARVLKQQQYIKKDHWRRHFTYSTTNMLHLCAAHAMLGNGMEPAVQLAQILERRRTLQKYAHHVLPLDAIHIDHKLLNLSRVRRWKKHGLKVRAWTVNDVKRAEELAMWGVDAILTDKPKLLGSRG